jgi:hypothetical protein
MSKLPSEITGRSAIEAMAPRGERIPAADPELAASRLVYSMQALDCFFSRTMPANVPELYKKLEMQHPDFKWSSFAPNIGTILSYAIQSAERNHHELNQVAGGGRRYNPAQQGYSRVETLQTLFYDKVPEARINFLDFPDYLERRLEMLNVILSAEGIHPASNIGEKSFEIARNNYGTRTPITFEEEYYVLAGLRVTLSHRLFLTEREASSPASALNAVIGAHGRDYDRPKVLDLDLLIAEIPNFIDSLAEVKKLGILADNIPDRRRGQPYGYDAASGFPQLRS